MNPFGMSKKIKKGSQNYTEAEIFSDRRNSPIINTNKKTKNRGCWEKIYNRGCWEKIYNPYQVQDIHKLWRYLKT